MDYDQLIMNDSLGSRAGWLSSSVVRDGRKCSAIQKEIDHFEVLLFSLSTIAIIFDVLYRGYLFPAQTVHFHLPSHPQTLHCSHLYLLSSASCHIALLFNIRTFVFYVLKIPVNIAVDYHIVIGNESPIS